MWPKAGVFAALTQLQLSSVVNGWVIVPPNDYLGIHAAHPQQPAEMYPHRFRPRTRAPVSYTWHTAPRYGATNCTGSDRPFISCVSAGPTPYVSLIPSTATGATVVRHDATTQRTTSNAYTNIATTTTTMKHSSLSFAREVMCCLLI